MTYTELKAAIRAIQAETGIDIPALNSKKDDLQAWLDNYLASQTELETIKSSEPEAISTDVEVIPEVTADELKHEELGIWIAFIILTIYQFCKPIAIAAARQSWQVSKKIFKRLEAKSLPSLQTFAIKATW
jgi:membrane-bound lytic murein transglycosylase B